VTASISLRELNPKYRVPRQRRAAIPRRQLVDRINAAIADHAVIGVGASAGFGKTTLLVQVAESIAEPGRVAWMTVDEDDDSVAGFFGSLAHCLQGLALDWSQPPTELQRALAGAANSARVAAAAVAAALESSPAAPIVVFVDDLHRGTAPGVGEFLEALIERLPVHVCLVLASRAALPVPMARWVVSGEALEVTSRELAFSVDEAMAVDRSQATGSTRSARVRDVLARTGGWAAGTAMLLRDAHDTTALGETRASHQALYDYLAGEVFDRLEPALQDFALRCSILSDMTPQLCAAVTGCADARGMLRALYRQDLFVTAVDSNAPTLRFHDLFRDFLQARLAREAPALLRELHGRAGRAESTPMRAIAHFLDGECWSEALQLLAADIDALVAAGHRETVRRWIERIPADVVTASDAGLYVRGYSAWLHYDWISARADMGALAARSSSRGADPPSHLMLFRLGLSAGLGEGAEADELEAALATHDLPPFERASLAVQRAWRAMGAGDLALAVVRFREFVDLATQRPREILPLVADRASLYVGVPHALPEYERLIALARSQASGAPGAWQTGCFVIEGWTALWRGQRDSVARAIESAKDVARRFSSIPAIDDALARLEAVYLASAGRGADALRIAHALVRRFESPEYESLRIVFERAYWSGYGKVAWMVGDRVALQRAADRLLAPRRPQEWRFIELVQLSLRGQLALLAAQWPEAQRHLAAAVELHRALRFPQGHPDPRICAAYVECELGNAEGARAYLEPVIAECLLESAAGPFLCEPAFIVDRVLATLSAEQRDRPAVRSLLATIAAWRDQSQSPARSGPLARLTERELEVLARVAQGDENKDIARRFDLSLHTVKRHIVNILGKLDCVSRKQAAELFRAAMNSS
jgi:LuxR family transcriptional regulator, maltose regulon positive regulatory protein